MNLLYNSVRMDTLDIERENLINMRVQVNRKTGSRKRVEMLVVKVRVLKSLINGRYANWLKQAVRKTVVLDVVGSSPTLPTKLETLSL